MAVITYRPEFEPPWAGPDKCGQRLAVTFPLKCDRPRRGVGRDGAVIARQEMREACLSLSVEEA